MSRYDPPLWAVEEVRQLNRLFLGFLRSRPAVAANHFGLPPRALDLLLGATADDVDRAADFPRALFRLSLAVDQAEPAPRRPGRTDDEGRRILAVTLLHSAWHLSRASGYAARLLLRLSDSEIWHLRETEVDRLLLLAEDHHLVRAAFDELEWIWQELLTESRPEQRLRLHLIGLQPDFAVRSARTPA
jgi:hypothetical protein